MTQIQFLLEAMLNGDTLTLCQEGKNSIKKEYSSITDEALDAGVKIIRIEGVNSISMEILYNGVDLYDYPPSYIDMPAHPASLPLSTRIDYAQNLTSIPECISGFEVSPVRSSADNDGSVEKCIPADAQAWGIYAVDCAGFAQWIADTATEKDANGILAILSHIGKRMVRERQEMPESGLICDITSFADIHYGSINYKTLDFIQECAPSYKDLLASPVPTRTQKEADNRKEHIYSITILDEDDTDEVYAAIKATKRVGDMITISHDLQKIKEQCALYDASYFRIINMP